MADFFFNPELLYPTEAMRRSNADVSGVRRDLCLMHQPIAARVTDELWRAWTPTGERPAAIRLVVTTAASSSEEAERIIDAEFRAHQRLKNHPFIAGSLHTGGSGFGAYAAYELDAEWFSIDQYSAEMLLDAQDRLNLFMRVLDAFAYAHDREVAHGRFDAGQVVCFEQGLSVYGFGALPNADCRDDINALGELLTDLLDGYGRFWWSEWVQQVIDKARSTDPEDRYQDAGEMVKAMEFAMSRRRRAKWVAGRAAAVLGLVVAMVLAGILSVGTDPPRIIFDHDLQSAKLPLGDAPYGDDYLARYSRFDAERDLLAWSSVDGSLWIKDAHGKRLLFEDDAPVRSFDVHPNRPEIAAVLDDRRVVLLIGDDLKELGLESTQVWYTDDGECVYLYDRDLGHLSMVDLGNRSERWRVALGRSYILALRGGMQGIAVVTHSQSMSRIRVLDGLGGVIDELDFESTDRVTAIDYQDGTWVLGTSTGDVYMSKGGTSELISEGSPSYVTHVRLIAEDAYACVIRTNSATIVSLDGEELQVLQVMEMQCHDLDWSLENGVITAATDFGVYQWQIALSQ